MNRATPVQVMTVSQSLMHHGVLIAGPHLS